MKQLYQSSAAICFLYDVTTGTGRKKNKHRPYLLALTLHNIGHYPVEQCHACTNGVLELPLKRNHFVSNGLFYLLQAYSHKPVSCFSLMCFKTKHKKVIDVVPCSLILKAFFGKG